MKLENFLEEYTGCLLVVSHDRHLLDRICSHLFVFEGNGKIKDYPFTYSSYIEQEKTKQREAQLADKTKESSKQEYQKSKTAPAKRKLSYKEQREKEEIERLLPQLEKEKQELEEKLNQGVMSHEELTEATSHYQKISEQIDEKELRWLELTD